MTIASNGVTLALPASRKLPRSSLIYKWPKSGRPQSPLQLLWDGPNDPRGELRWCLSKIKLLDGPDRQGDDVGRQGYARPYRRLFL